jgi:anti-anti-sigma factor
MQCNDFTVCTRVGPDTLIIVRGELDLATVTRFEAACDSIDFSSVGRAVLDLRELVFMDARGLRGVLRLHETCLDQSVDLVIKPGPRAVHRVFELTGTHVLLPFDNQSRSGGAT